MSGTAGDKASSMLGKPLRGLLIPAIAFVAMVEARASIDEEVSRRVSAIEEVIERLEFDADRIGSPPAYRQAIDAFTGAVCAALTASADIDFTWTPISESLMGEGEAEAPAPSIVIGVELYGKKRMGYGANAGLSVISDHSSGVTHRLCVNLVPWAVYAYYRGLAEVPGQADFPEIVPDEVFLQSQIAYDTPAEMRQASRIEGEWTGLSPEALAFLEAIGTVVLDGLDDGSSGTQDFPWISSRIHDVVHVLGLSANGVVSAASGLAEVIPISAATFTEGVAIGEIFSAFHSLPERMVSRLPFAPSMDWLPQSPFGFDSLSELDYCASLSRHGPVSEVPYLDDMLDASCEVLGLIETGANELIAASTNFIGTVIAEQSGSLDKVASELGEMEVLVSAYGPIVKQFYHQVIGYIGDKTYAVTVLVKELADGIWGVVNM